MQIRELQRNWDEFGKRDPLWAILTDPEKQGNKWDLDEFFQTGREEIDELVSSVRSIGISLQPGQALDFGCGVGRLTQALSEYFESATGVDIAPSMIELAGQCNSKGDRCHYILNESDDLHLFEENTFAFVYCNYVLQHMRPEYSVRYIQEFVRVLQPGGMLVFQLPSEIVALKERIKAALPSQVRKAYQRLSQPKSSDAPLMETHAVPRASVERVLESSGARLLHVRSNPQHDGRWHSLLYYVTKPTCV